MRCGGPLLAVPELVIDGMRVADDTDAYVVAEIGQNHCGSVDICKKMIEAAKWAGCNAVKLQKRHNKTLYAPEFYSAPYNSENAFGPTYGAHREALEFNFDQYKQLQDFAAKAGITLFATAFDIRSADFLFDIDMPALKIASGDLTNLRLLRHVAKTWNGKPVIFSTGGGTEAQVKAAHGILYHLDGNLAVMQCTSAYPAPYDQLDLRVIQTFADWFPNTTIGWSGHDTGIAMAPVAYAFGARIIEKHFTLNRAWKGTDQAFSLEPQGMKTMIDNLKATRAAIGDGVKRVHASEIEPLKKQRKNAAGQIDGKEVQLASV